MPDKADGHSASVAAKYQRKAEDPDRKAFWQRVALVVGLLALAAVVVGLRVQAARQRQAQMWDMARGGAGGPGGPDGPGWGPPGARLGGPPGEWSGEGPGGRPAMAGKGGWARGGGGGGAGPRGWSGFGAGSGTTGGGTSSGGWGARGGWGGPGGPGGPGKGPGRPPSAAQMMERMTGELNLTPAQKAQTQAIARETDTKMQAVMSDTTLSREERHAKRRAVFNSSVQKLLGTLTPEQRELVGKRRDGSGWRSERGGRKGPPPGGRPGGPPR